MTARAQHATSADGTQIAYWCFGHGTSILIVHGLGSTHSPYVSLAELLGNGFTGCAMDRRGRGDSGDTLPYALEREFEDVVAVGEQLGRTVVLGYSFGGPPAIEAARASDAITALIMFESWMSPLSEIPEDLVTGVEQLVAQGRYEDALNYGDSPEEVEQTRQLPDYAERVGIAHLTPRELRGWDRYWHDHPVDDARWGTLDKPVLFLVSEENRDEILPPAQQFADHMPQANVRVLEGIGHRAYRDAPDILAKAIQSWISTLSGDR